MSISPSVSDLATFLTSYDLVDLSHDLHIGMPQSLSTAPFRLSLETRHGDKVRVDGSSHANELITMPAHIGTHIDALSHISVEGHMYGGVDVASTQTTHGFRRLGIETFTPFVGRGVLLDVAAVHDAECLPAAHEVGPDELAEAERRTGVRIEPGDAVFVATGWATRWPDAPDFVGTVHGAPGPGADGAQWLAERRPSIVAGETIAFEHIPAGAGHAALPAHRILIAESGIHIMEMVNLQGLRERRVGEFLVMISPLRLTGATGSPVRPLAWVPRTAEPAERARG